MTTFQNHVLLLVFPYFIQNHLYIEISSPSTACQSFSYFGSLLLSMNDLPYPAILHVVPSSSLYISQPLASANLKFYFLLRHSLSSLFSISINCNFNIYLSRYIEKNDLPIICTFTPIFFLSPYISE